MKCSRRVVLLIPLAVALGTVLWALLQRADSEPQYDGKALSYWLTCALNNRFGDAGKARQATNAVHQLGTNALPCLLKWMDGDIPNWRKGLLESAPRQTLTYPGLVRPLLGPDGTRLLLGITGFEILGQEAAPAVPVLVARAANANSEFKTEATLVALSWIGNSGLTGLVSLVTNSSIPAPQRINAARLLAFPIGCPRTNLTWAVPALARCAGETEISKAAIDALAALAKQSAGVVPELVQACSSTEPMTREGATNALAVIAPQPLVDPAR